MVKLYPFLIATLPLITAFAWGNEFNYRQQDGVTVYAAKVAKNDPETILLLPDVNFSQLHRIADLSVEKETRLSTDINPDQYDCDENNRCQHGYLSDGRVILWAGRVLQNPEGTPRVYIASFKAFGPFAADKYSLYFDGQRSDDNAAEKRVDMATLEKTEVWNLLRDKNNLYLKGRWLASADGFRILRQASSTEYIALTTTQVIVNGVPITADAQTFHIVRWMPGDWLRYRDKNGEHDYEIDGGCNGCATFVIGLRNVTWLKHEETSAGSDCRAEILPDVDPEYFYRLNGNTGWYKDRIYQVEINALGEGTLRIFAPQELKLGYDDFGAWYYHHNLYFSADGQLFRLTGEDSWERYNPAPAIWTAVSQVPGTLIPLYPQKAP